MAGLFCRIVTPTEELFASEVSYVGVPGEEGGYGVLPGHEMFVTTHSKGKVTVWMDANGSDKKEFLVYNGASQVFNDMVTVIARFGAKVDGLDAAEIRSEIEEATKQVEALTGSEDENDKLQLDVLQAQLDWSNYKLEHITG